MSTATRTHGTKVARTRFIGNGVAEALSSNGADIYTVNLSTGACDCPAGRNGRACYHVATATARYQTTDGPTFVHRAYFTTLRRPTAGSGVVIDASARFATDNLIDAASRFRPDDDTPPAAPAGAVSPSFGDTLLALADVASVLREAAGFSLRPSACRGACTADHWVEFGTNTFCLVCCSWVRPATEWHAILTSELRRARQLLPAAA